MSEHPHDPSPHGEDADEPLGPLTPDEGTAAGDTPEAHDEVSPHDLPVDHPGRVAAERQAEANVARGGDYTTRGDADPSEVDRSQASVAHDTPSGERGRS